MLTSQIEYMAAMKAGRTQAAIEEAKRQDKASHAELNQLRSLPHNSTCADCDAMKPGWAALPHGVFICMDCAQMHRFLGRHISQTKAINTGTYLWMPYEIAVMREVGNGVASRAFADAGLPPKPNRGAPEAQRLAYAEAKYVKCQPNWKLAASPPISMVPVHHDPMSMHHALLPAAASKMQAPPKDLMMFDDIPPAQHRPEAAIVPQSANWEASFGVWEPPQADVLYSQKKTAVLQHFKPAHICTPAGHGKLPIQLSNSTFFSQYGL